MPSNRYRPVDIEKAEVSDAKEILTLQKLAYRSEAELYSDHGISPMIQTLAEILGQFNRQEFLKAVIDSKIVGSVRAYSKQDTCYIGRLIVHPDFQNRGIGTTLMKEIEAMFRSCRRFELFTGMKSERNIRFYQKLGFQIFRSEPVSDKLTMVFLEKTTT
jgi:ribosomal protein S18 acetylase RimI-like enzyme